MYNVRLRSVIEADFHQCHSQLVAVPLAEHVVDLVISQIITIHAKQITPALSDVYSYDTCVQ